MYATENTLKILCKSVTGLFISPQVGCIQRTNYQQQKQHLNVLDDNGGVTD